MRRAVIFLAVLWLGLFTACAHREARKSENIARLTVGVGGPVKRGGWVRLNPPLTLEHAIQEAGGLTQLEERLNKQATVWHADGSTSRVQRKDYPQFELREGDQVGIPRHY